jgi:hypothetical protein
MNEQIIQFEETLFFRLTISICPVRVWSSSLQSFTVDAWASYYVCSRLCRYMHACMYVYVNSSK